MKKKLVVIDLDNTLIGADSFQLYMKKRRRKGSVTAIFLTWMRRFRIISLSRYKHLAIQLLLTNDTAITAFCKDLIKITNKPLLEKLHTTYSDTAYTVLILSASPDVYVKQLGNLLGLKSVGSHYNSASKRFLHLHGVGKADYVLQHYPQAEYIYEYAISDSTTDQFLLDLFAKGELIQPYIINDGK